MCLRLKVYYPITTWKIMQNNYLDIIDIDIDTFRLRRSFIEKGADYDTLLHTYRHLSQKDCI